MKRFQVHPISLILLCILGLFLAGCDIERSEAPASGSIAARDINTILPDGGVPVSEEGTTDPTTPPDESGGSSDTHADTSPNEETGETVKDEGSSSEGEVSPNEETAPDNTTASADTKPTIVIIQPTPTPASGGIVNPTAIPTATSTPPIASTIPDSDAAGAASSATASGASGQQTHTVQAGENLYRIALSYGVTYDALAQLNNIVNANRIYVGQVLRIPESSSGISSNSSTTFHVVRAGETLLSISRRYSVDTQALIRANNISNPNHIYIGQRLVIP